MGEASLLAESHQEAPNAYPEALGEAKIGVPANIIGAKVLAAHEQTSHVGPTRNETRVLGRIAAEPLITSTGSTATIEAFTFLREEDRPAMEVQFLGHSGLFIKTRHATILCDPFINWTSDDRYHGAFYASWFPMPDNHPESSGIDLDEIANPTYLYVSHIHEDHGEESFLRNCVNKNTTVLLPDFAPLTDLKEKLERFGFKRFLDTRNNEPFEIDGLEVNIQTMMTWADGPMGDSTMYLRDMKRNTGIFVQNDGRPINLSFVRQQGCAAHLLATSGAVSYPDQQLWSLKMEEYATMRNSRGARKTATARERAKRYIGLVAAKQYFPIAGPPAFLGNDLQLGLNYAYSGNQAWRAGNAFPPPDQFVEWMQRRGQTNGRILLPGMKFTVAQAGCRVPDVSDEHIRQAFHDQRTFYAYKQRMESQVMNFMDGLARSTHNIDDNDYDHCHELQDRTMVPYLATTWEPLLKLTPKVCEAVGSPGIVRLALTSVGNSTEQKPRMINIDFKNGRIGEWAGEKVATTFVVEEAIIDHFLRTHEPAFDKVLLSMRQLELLNGPFPEAAYAWLNALTPKRAKYLNSIWGGREDGSAVVRIGERYYRVLDACPMHKAPWPLMLSYDPKTNQLICHGHDARWDKQTGRCLTGGPEYDIILEDLGDSPGPEIQRICHHCPTFG